jgi:copper oxidase (laccase) domain-containing protein
VFTTRAGGESAPPYDSLNLGDHVGDDVFVVGRNRAHLAQVLQAHPVFMKQVHGHHVQHLDAHTSQGIEADACWTQTKGVACTIMVADCLPVLYTDRQGSFVAAAHAGWRGLAGVQGLDDAQGGPGVLEVLQRTLLKHLNETSQRRVLPSDLLVWLGPCIGPQAFEVGQEVKVAFESYDPQATFHFKRIQATAHDRMMEAAMDATFGVAGHSSSKFLADLAGVARQRLKALGVQNLYGNDSSPAWCTVTQQKRFFSHRRDKPSGRMAACIWLI